MDIQLLWSDMIILQFAVICREDTGSSTGEYVSAYPYHVSEKSQTIGNSLTHAGNCCQESPNRRSLCPLGGYNTGHQNLRSFEQTPIIFAGYSLAAERSLSIWPNRRGGEKNRQILQLISELFIPFREQPPVSTNECTLIYIRGEFFRMIQNYRE